MKLTDRIHAFDKLGNILSGIHKDGQFKAVLANVTKQNPWFVKKNIEHAVLSVSSLLKKDSLYLWVSQYDLNNIPKKVGVIVPGNIPLVGFLDFLCVLISGNIYVGQLSHSNNILLPFIASILIKIDMRFNSCIKFPDNLSDLDFLIATGNDTTAKFFNYRHIDLARIIRKNRNSVAVLNGLEDEIDYKGLFFDIVMYFGLGCRNVSKIFVPANFNWNKLEEVFNELDYLFIEYYMDNLTNQMALCEINSINYLKFNKLLFIENNYLSSPVGVVFYEYYTDLQSVINKINSDMSNIQCVVTNIKSINKSVSFGKAQHPTLYDWPDGIDVIDSILK